ncbi:hypothetical protein L596_014898 [Steinernema carpocapsae]|uniref:Uncharacterized protein n=1 Tax=Steinernema carpocapsae TaxID=34508 RepID=A0A4U5ND89_STECR|nr:hypothetical protein L596_014898 [Steinernema carpocapsae]
MLTSKGHFRTITTSVHVDSTEFRLEGDRIAADEGRIDLCKRIYFITVPFPRRHVPRRFLLFYAKPHSAAFCNSMPFATSPLLRFPRGYNLQQ